MGTRGACGYYVNGKEKVTYNHFDSYPGGLGNNVVEYIRTHPILDIKKVAEEIELVESNSIPTPKQIKECVKYTDLTVSERSTSEWYCLLRETHGDLNVYHDGLKYMIDSSNFLKDSLFCEWAYIINVDTNKLEVYKGFNQNKYSNGRYASSQVEKNYPNDPQKYFGVSLISEIELKKLKNLSPLETDNFLGQLDHEE